MVNPDWPSRSEDRPSPIYPHAFADVSGRTKKRTGRLPLSGPSIAFFTYPNSPPLSGGENLDEVKTGHFSQKFQRVSAFYGEYFCLACEYHRLGEAPLRVVNAHRLRNQTSSGGSFFFLGRGSVQRRIRSSARFRMLVFWWPSRRAAVLNGSATELLSS